MAQIKVSIIIPIYNVEEYIEECLVSAIHQTLKEIEIICVNDGTPDHSMDIVKKYAENDSRIVIVEKENGGLSSARNAGMRVAQGEYIYFLDSDDYILDNAMEFLYHEAKENELDDIYFDAESFFETEELKKEMSLYIDYYVRKADYSQVVTGVELLKKMEDNKEARLSACLQLIRREFLIENKIRFEEGIIHEDNIFSLECMLEAKKVKHVPNQFYMRRVRAESIMTSLKELQSSFGYFMCLEKISERLRGKEYSKEIKRAISNRLTAMQSNAVNKNIKVSEEEMEEFLDNLPARMQVLYGMMVNRVATERKRSNETRQHLHERVERFKSDNRSLKRKNERLEKKINKITRSISYRGGKKLFFLPDFIMEIRRDIKRRGKKYALWKIKNMFQKNKILVSIIIPVYNAEKYLRICLETIEAQTLENIEVICVNDGSEDDSVNILEEFAKRDRRFRVIDKENTGAGDCRNVGLREAKGEYVLFLDADDKFNHMLCDKAYFKAKMEKADICFFGANRLNMETNQVEPMNWVLRKVMLPPETPFKREQMKNKFFQFTTGCPWSKLFRREFLLEHHLEFQNLKNANDLYFVRAAMALADRMTYIRKPLVTYRFAAGDNTQSNKHKAPLEFYKAYKALKEKLIQEGVYEELEQSFVNIAFDDCIFNIRTTQTQEAKEQIMRVLKEEGFAYFEFDKYPEEYFFNKNSYEEYKKIKEVLH